MFIFGHIGITIGIVFIVSHLVPRLKIRNKVNYWFVAFGAILPDLIDKNWFALFFFMFKNSYVPDISYTFVSEVMGLAIVLLFVCGWILQRKYKS